jgi:hypothetical protein
VLYTHWAPGVSTPYSETEDCVESSGRDMKYHWQPSSCDNCRDFTCRKGKNEYAYLKLNTKHGHTLKSMSVKVSSRIRT